MQFQASELNYSECYEQDSQAIIISLILISEKASLQVNSSLSTKIFLGWLNMQLVVGMYKLITRVCWVHDVNITIEKSSYAWCYGGSLPASPQHHNDNILVCRLMPSYVMFLNWIHSYLQQIKLWTQTKWMIFCCNSLSSKSSYCAEIRDTVYTHTRFARHSGSERQSVLFVHH